MTALEDTPDIGAISAFLLDIYRAARTLGYRAMQRFVFDRYQKLVPCTGGLLGVGTLEADRPAPYDVFLFGMPDELMTSWDAVKHEDRLAFAALGSPATTFAASADGPMYEGCEGARRHCARFGIAHLVCTAHVHLEVGLYAVMSAYRGDDAPPFSEAERRTTEAISLHVLEAVRMARLEELRARTSEGTGHGWVTALASEGGIVIEAEPELPERLRRHWAGWRGPTLPPELLATAAAGGGTARFGRVVVRVSPLDGMRLVQVRGAAAADDLTAREREVAARFALGETHREVSERLGIAPATVRRHLANVYEKLGVTSKAELDRMLRVDEG